MTADVAALAEKAADHHRAGRLDEAEAAWREALAEKPDNPSLRHNLAVVLAQRGDPEGALDLLDAVTAAEPGYAAAHFNRGNALLALGRRREAIDAYRRVCALEPDHYAAHRTLGFLWLAEGDRDRSLDYFARTYDLNRGDDRSGIAARSLRTAAPHKLRHDAELFRHLPPRIRDGKRFELLAWIYEGVAGEIGEGVVELSGDLLERLGPDYNAAIHVIDAPEAAGGAIRPELDGAAIEREYRAAAPGLVWFDGLLSPRALAGLRRFLQESTVWHDFAHIDGFVATYLEDGFACPLVLQIADEFRARLPGLLGPHPLTQAWAFKGVAGDLPIDVHADDAAISLNFWVTPESANRNPETGGLVVYRTPPPADWPIADYDADIGRIRTFLAENGESAVTVPYLGNRAVLFESRLFHGSDAPNFAAGYENMRINVTMLFGTREGM